MRIEQLELPKLKQSHLLLTIVSLHQCNLPKAGMVILYVNDGKLKLKAGSI